MAQTSLEVVRHLTMTRSLLARGVLFIVSLSPALARFPFEVALVVVLVEWAEAAVAGQYSTGDGIDAYQRYRKEDTFSERLPISSAHTSWSRVTCMEPLSLRLLLLWHYYMIK